MFEYLDNNILNVKHIFYIPSIDKINNNIFIVFS